MEKLTGKEGKHYAQILTIRLLSGMTSDHLCFSRPQFLHVQNKGSLCRLYGFPSCTNPWVLPGRRWGETET